MSTTPEVPAAPGTLSRSVARSVAFNSAGKLFSLGLAFVLTPFVLHHLTQTQYGLWMLVISVAGYASLLDLGINSAIVKYVAEHSSRRDYAATRGTLATAFWMYGAIATVGVMLSGVAALAFPYVFSVAPADRATASWLMFVVGGSVSLALPCTLPAAALRALQRFDLLNAWSIAGGFLGAAATVVTLLVGGKLLALAVVNLATMLVMQIPAVIMVRRVAPEIGFGWTGGSRSVARSIFGFSVAVAVTDVAGRMQTKSDEMVIGAFLSLSAVTPYSLGRRLSELPQVIAHQFLKVLLPIASQLHARGEEEQRRFLLITSFRITLAMFLPIACAITVLAPAVLTVWVGSQYSEASVITVVLVIACLFNTLMWPAGSMLQAMARHRPMAVAAMISALANILLSIYLAQTLGILGVAYGTLIPTILEFFFVVPFTMRLTGASAFNMLRQGALPVALPALNLCATLWLLGQWFPPGSVVGLGAVCASGWVVYLATYCYTGSATLECRFFIGELQRWFGLKRKRDLYRFVATRAKIEDI